MLSFLLLSVEQKRYDTALEEKKRVEQNLLYALEDAGRAYENVVNSSDEKRKQALVASFFQALYAAEGILGEEEKQKELCMYIPMLIAAEEDGAYFYYLQETKNGAVREIRHIWSDKIPYEYVDDCTEAEKKNAVATALEKTASEIITNHNYIAGQYGVIYSFYAPKFLQDTTSALHFPMLYAVVQGWPLLAAGKVTYNNCIDAGVYIQKSQKYTVTGPENLERPECRYHVNSCGLLQTEEVTVCRENINRKTAILEYGAYPCEQCIPGQ